MVIAIIILLIFFKLDVISLVKPTVDKPETVSNSKSINEWFSKIVNSKTVVEIQRSAITTIAIDYYLQILM